MINDLVTDDLLSKDFSFYLILSLIKIEDYKYLIQIHIIEGPLKMISR